MKQLILLLALYSCRKENIVSPLHFKMNENLMNLQVYEAYAEYSCGVRIYEVTAYHNGGFFKINFTDKDTLKPGVFKMGENPINTVAGTSTFWYTHDGYSYTARPFTVAVQSYNKGELKASFYGGIVSEGVMNIKIQER